MQPPTTPTPTTPSQIDPAVPTNIPDDQLHNFPMFLDQVLANVLGSGADPIYQTGLRLWSGLAAIVVVWKGLQIAYSGNFQPWEMVRTIVGLWIPWVMLQYYTANIPGVGYSFPGVVVAGGTWLQNYFLADLTSSWNVEMNKLSASMNASMNEKWAALDIWGALTDGAHLVMTAAIEAFTKIFLFFSMLILYALTYAQVLWAQIAIGILVFLGPIFIPWLVFEPMSFLFWGWFRSLVTFSLYGAIAGAVMRVFMGVGLGFVTTYAQADTSQAGSIVNVGKWMLALIPLVLAGIWASLKVGELASMLVSGGGGGGGGPVAVVATQAVRGAAKVATKGGAG